MTIEEEMADLYGPAALFAEHRRGDRVRYTESDYPEATGMIIWIATPTDARAMQYVVELEHRSGFPYFIAPGDVLEVLANEPMI